MNYHDCLERLFTANARGIKLGLANMQAIMALLGCPHAAFPAIHIAGTNGKGSTATKIAAALTHQGYKVGLYTSPHISTFCERIQIDGKMISTDDVTSYLNEIVPLSESNGIFLTFFEYATALALLYFAKEKVDFAVLETGLGGRLDATNICKSILTVITSISLDHTDLLGDTKDKIAVEKAGIMKEGVPCVVGPSVLKSVVEERAKQLNCPLYYVKNAFSNYEEENRSIALSALQVLSSQIQLDKSSILKGLEALPPCRFQILSSEELERRFAKLSPKCVILDVAHNPDGIGKLFSRLHEPVCVVAGFSKDKDVIGCLSQMREVSALFFVRAPSSRAMPSDELVKAARVLQEPIFAYENLTEGLQQAFDYAAEKRQILVICGTFYIMSESRRFLGFCERADPFDLNEKVVGTRSVTRSCVP